MSHQSYPVAPAPCIPTHSRILPNRQPSSRFCPFGRLCLPKVPCATRVRPKLPCEETSWSTFGQWFAPFLSIDDLAFLRTTKNWPQNYKWIQGNGSRDRRRNRRERGETQTRQGKENGPNGLIWLVWGSSSLSSRAYESPFLSPLKDDQKHRINISNLSYCRHNWRYIEKYVVFEVSLAPEAR